MKGGREGGHGGELFQRGKCQRKKEEGKGEGKEEEKEEGQGQKRRDPHPRKASPDVPSTSLALPSPFCPLPSSSIPPATTSYLSSQVRRPEAQSPEVARALGIEGEERLGGRHGQQHVHHVEDRIHQLLHPRAALGEAG